MVYAEYYTELNKSSKTIYVNENYNFNYISVSTIDIWYLSSIFQVLKKSFK